MRYQGKITRWKDDQGFGFIAPNGGGEAAFVHIKAFARRGRRPVDGEVVSYELRFDVKGRGRAEAVAFADERSAVVSRRSRAVGSSGRWGLWLAVLFMVFVLAGAWLGKLPRLVPAIYLAASLLALVTYAWDKSAARRGAWRTQENTLHLIALVGGWPGALLAQRLLRHKSQKASFLAIFWVTVLLNGGVLGWLLTAKGAAFLRSMSLIS